MFLRSPLIKFPSRRRTYTRLLLKRRKSRVGNFRPLNFYYHRTIYDSACACVACALVWLVRLCACARIPVAAITATDLRGYNPFRQFAASTYRPSVRELFFTTRTCRVFNPGGEKCSGRANNNAVKT